ncbi:MAG: CHASE2 domain-containing protein, partial [bacterium]|nr:CHASE2 domain-containing protein [bacterium]
MRSLFRSSRATSALVSLIVALAVWLMGACGLLGPVERAGRDAVTRLASVWPAAIPYALPDVAVVVADSPLSLEHCAGAIRRLEAAGVRGIALDLGTLPPDDSPGVKSLARAIVESGKVALAVGAEHDLSATMLSERAAALGHIAIDADVDGVVRHASYSSATPLGRLPILGAVALEVAGVAPAPLQDGEFAIDFRRTRPHFAVISLSDLLGDRFDPGAVAGRVVFIAATLEPSLHTTPIAPATPSVYLHATGYRTLAAAHAGEPVPHARPLWRGWLWAGALSLALGAISGMPGIARLTILLLTGVALIAAAPLGAVAFGVLDPPVAAFLIFAAHCVLASDRLRSRLGLQPDPEEFSLALLAGARNATLGGRAGTDRDLEVPLAMMGRAVGATAVSLVRFAASATSINWRPGLPDEFRCPQVGSLDIARRVAERGEVEFCEGALPADPVAWLRPSSALYVPMLDEGTSMGVLVIEGEG